MKAVLLEKFSKLKPFGLVEDSNDYFFVVKDLFKTHFIANCHLDNASVTDEEIMTLEELDHLEVLENLKDLLESLVSFKRNMKESSSEELALRCEKLEKMLQKQEADVRKHISNEHQLKLLVEGLQQKNAELELKYENAQHIIKTLELSTGESVNEKISNLETHFAKEIAKISQKFKVDTQSLSVETQKIRKLEENYNKKEKSYLKLLQDFTLMKGLLEKTTSECVSLRKEIEKHSSLGSQQKILTKRRQDLIESSLNKVHAINKSLILENSKKLYSQKKKCENPLLKQTKPPDAFLLSDPRSPLKSNHSKRHMRSHSDYNHPSSWKKIHVKHLI
jgi:hypothetical protein